MKTIIEMAREYAVGGLEFDAEGLALFVDAIRADEREACAKVCEELGMATNGMAQPEQKSVMRGWVKDGGNWYEAEAKAFYGFPHGPVSASNAGGNGVTDGETSP